MCKVFNYVWNTTDEMRKRKYIISQIADVFGKQQMMFTEKPPEKPVSQTWNSTAKQDFVFVNYLKFKDNSAIFSVWLMPTD